MVTKQSKPLVPQKQNALYYQKIRHSSDTSFFMINSTSLCSFIFASKCPYRWFGRILFDSIEITKDFHYLSFHLVSCELDVTRVESLITRDVAEN